MPADSAAGPPPRLSASGHDVASVSEDRIRELAADLTDEEARILLRQGTEAPFCGAFHDHKSEGVYLCRLCRLPLFNSSAKFDSGTGWPSFFEPYDPDHVAYREDATHGMRRVEIVCRRCGGHLGHVFPDGPPPSGQRYCLNSVSLTFHEDGSELPDGAQPVATETAYFGAGCFWGVEDAFQRVDGVIDATSGYQGGHVDDPGYKQVCAGTTGHAETVRVTFDPSRVTYRDLLEMFFKIHDATQKNRQGPDVGTQYRSAIFTTSDAQLDAAKQYVAELSQSGRYVNHPITTEIAPAPTFYEAEAYHQDYNERHGRTCGI